MMKLILPEEKKFNISKTEVAWCEDTLNVLFSRAINSTIKSVSIPSTEAELLSKLKRIGNMSDNDFAWLCDF